MALHTSTVIMHLGISETYVVAERLSARLLFLQSVFSIGGVWPQLPSRFRNAAISHTLGMQLVTL